MGKIRDITVGKVVSGRRGNESFLSMNVNGTEMGI